MRKRPIRQILLPLLGAASLALLGCLGTAAALRAETSPSSYLPSISDLMIATIQPRHVRLWIAAHSGNWAFGAYELGNLKGAFARIGRAHPLVDQNSFLDMTVAVTQQPFESLAQAIKTKDIGGFDKAYGDLTAACNACHQATNHGVVVIRVPDRADVADQDFAPAAP
jgi:hypothetical protein